MVATVVDACFVGRDAELAVLREAFAAARSGTGRTIVISGPAGIGKSSLVHASCREFVGTGASVLVGGCPTHSGGDIAYAPFLTAWRTAPDPPGSGGFGELLAAVVALAGAPVAVARAWLADRLLERVGTWAADQPVVIVVEDAHWIDPSSLAVLDVLARAAPRLRLLLVVTVRDGDGTPARLVELATSPSGVHLPLGPLDPAAVHLLARAAGSDDPEAVVRRSEGHPLFAAELARAGGGDIPPTLRALLSARLRELGPGGVAVVAAVALAGDSATESMGTEIAGADALSAALRRGLLVAEPGTDTVRLRHRLVGEVVEAELRPAELRRLSRAVVSFVESAAPAATRARLWERAGDDTRARLAWVDAGREAEASCSYAEAARMYGRALQLAVTPDIVLAAAEALRCAGESEQAEAVLRQGLDAVPPPDPAARCLLLHALRERLYAAGRTAEAFDALAEARALAARLPHSAIGAKVEVAEAGRLMVLGAYAEGAEVGRRAAELASGCDDSATAAHALVIEGVCLAMTGEVDAGLALLARAQQHADGTGGVLDLTRVAGNRAYVLVNAGRYRECVRICEDALRRLDTLGLAATLGGTLTYNLVVGLVATGRWDDAEQRCAEPSPGSGGKVATLLLLRRAEIAALRGATDAAALVSRAASIDDDNPIVAVEQAYAEAVVARSIRRYRTAVGVCRALLARAGVGGMDRLRLAAVALGALADLEASGGRMRRLDDPVASAAELSARADAAAASWGALPVPPEAAALARLCRLEAARLRPDAGGPAAADAWSSLAGRWRELGMPYWFGYARLRAADVLVACRSADAAAEPLRHAYETARRLRAAPLVAEAERVARRGRLPLLDEPRGHVPTLTTLTRRENEVLELIGWGRTNREIATELYISERTAGVHVSRILAKLGARNRSEAARMARASERT